MAVAIKPLTSSLPPHTPPHPLTPSHSCVHLVCIDSAYIELECMGLGKPVCVSAVCASASGSCMLLRVSRLLLYIFDQHTYDYSCICVCFYCGSHDHISTVLFLWVCGDADMGIALELCHVSLVAFMICHIMYLSDYTENMCSTLIMCVASAAVWTNCLAVC